MQTYEYCKSLRLVGSDEVAEMVIDEEYSCDVLDSGTTETGNTRPVTSEQCGHQSMFHVKHCKINIYLALLPTNNALLITCAVDPIA